MIVRFNRFGQIDPAESTAAVSAASQPSPITFYLVAVAAGVTVYLITRAMSRKK